MLQVFLTSADVVYVAFAVNVVVEIDVTTDEGVLVIVRLITRMVLIAVLVIQLFASHTYQCNGKDIYDDRRTRGE